MSVAAQKYVYTPLCQLQEGTVVNVYGVVAFFKLPYRSKGTDFCSVVTIVDQSHEKLRCTFFSGSQDSLPKIYKVGDVVRFHRIKIKKFNSELYGVSSSGFSALAFDGTPGSPLLPRTSSKNYSFTKEDQTSVESLRNWQMGEGTFSRSRLKLSDIQPGQYFDLICQLIGKAELDKASYLLKVWDGTRCVLPTWKVFTEDNALVGDRDVISRLQYLSIDVLVYDNHVEAAKSLEVGSCIVIQNIHVKLHNSPNETEEQSSHLEFQLHGGTMYGRGITVLPENHGDVKELQQNLHTADLNDNSPLDAMSPLDLSTSENQLGKLFATKEYIEGLLPENCGHINKPGTPRKLEKSLPFDALERCQKLSVTVLPTHQQWPTTPLATIIESKAPQKCRIKAQLRGFQPRNLYQSIKLHCNKCCLLQNIKDEDVLNSIFLGNHTNCLTTSAHNKFWYQSVMWRRQPEDKSVTIHFVKKYDLLQNPEDSLILVEGGTYNELCKLSRYFNSIIPVKSKQEDLGIDLSAPFLIQGNRWHYGCIKCSSLKPIDVLNSLPHDTPWNAAEIAKALGIEPLIQLFVMQLTLEDETGSLDAYLWRHSEQFFQISASEIFMDNQLQERLYSILTILCPPAKPKGEYPWMDCCIKSYNSTNRGKERVSYEIFDTQIFFSPE